MFLRILVALTLAGLLLVLTASATPESAPIGLHVEPTSDEFLQPGTSSKT
jgi:hypothetical protein